MSRRRLILHLLFLLVDALLGVPVQATEPSTKPFPRIETGQHTAPITRIGADVAGRRLVTASLDKTARVWDLKSGALVRDLRPPIGGGNEGMLFAAALSPDGKTVAVAGRTKAGTGSYNVYLFDEGTGELTYGIGGLPSAIYHLAFPRTVPAWR